MTTLRFSEKSLERSAFYELCRDYKHEELMFKLKIDAADVFLVIESSDAYTPIYPDNMHPYDALYEESIKAVSHIVSRYPNSSGELKRYPARNLLRATVIELAFNNDDYRQLEVRIYE